MDDLTISDRLRRLPEDIDPDPDFEARLRRRLAAELAPPERRDGVRLVPNADDDEVSVRRSRVWPLWAVAAAAVSALALAVVTTVRSGEEPAPAEPVDSLPTPVDSLPTPAPPLPSTTTAPTIPSTPIVHTVEIASGDNPSRVAASVAHLWTMSLDGDLSRIDIDTLEITGTLRLPESSEIVAGPDALWFAGALDGQLLRIDPDSLELIGRINTGIDLIPDSWRPIGVAMREGARRTFAAIGGLAVGDGSVFVGDHAGVVLEFDATSLDEVRRLDVGVRPDIVRVTDDHVLVAAYRDDVVEVYTRADGVLRHRIDGLDQLLGAALGQDAAFAHDLATGTVIRLDLVTGETNRNEQLESPPVFEGLPVYSAGPAVSADALYVDVAGGIALLDPVTLEPIDTVELSGRGGDATVTPDGAAWIARYTDRSVVRIVPPER